MEAPGPLLPRIRLGQHLRAWREAALVKQEQAAKILGWKQTDMSKLESGKRAIRPAPLRELLAAYNVTDPADIQNAVALATWTKRKRTEVELLALNIGAKYSTYAGLEQIAKKISTVDMNVWCGLAHDEAYSRAVHLSVSPGTPISVVNEKVLVRGKRQQVLFRDPNPLELHMIVDEAVLWRLIGGRDVAIKQLRHVLNLIQRSNISVQVNPFTSDKQPGMVSSYAVLEFDGDDDPDVVYVEHLTDDDFPRADQVDRYRLNIGRMQQAALSVDQSASKIEEVLRYHETHP